MQTLRNTSHLARLVLVWFVLFVGVAVAAPLLNPHASQMVCSATGGMKMVNLEDGSSDATNLPSSMDCPLCTQVCAPPPPLALSFQTISVFAHAMRSIPAAHIAWVTASPLPPRGPPAHS